MQSCSVCDETGWYEELDDDGNGILVICCEGVEIAKVPSSKLGSTNWKWLKVNNKRIDFFTFHRIESSFFNRHFLSDSSSLRFTPRRFILFFVRQNIVDFSICSFTGCFHRISSTETLFSDHQEITYSTLLHYRQPILIRCIFTIYFCCNIYLCFFLSLSNNTAFNITHNRAPLLPNHLNPL